MTNNCPGWWQSKNRLILFLVGACLCQIGFAEITPDMAHNVALNCMADYAQTTNSVWNKIDNPSIYSENRLIDDLSIWPGDADNNGVVDMLDLYALVYYWYQTGVGRGVVEYGWNAHQVRPWANENATYADCDGSGQVDIRDAFPVCLNWGRTHAVTFLAKTPYFDIQTDSIRAVFMEIYQALENSDSEAAFEIRRYIENLLGLPISSDFELSQNYPNPFNPSTTIQFRLTGKTKIRLAIYDISGRLVKVLMDREEAAGSHNVIWDGRDQDGNPAATGIYFCRMDAFNNSRASKLVLMR